VNDTLTTQVGVVNLRGRIVTIIDLGLRLGFLKGVPRARPHFHRS
jgi:chemotaxis signal transduction protein